MSENTKESLTVALLIIASLVIVFGVLFLVARDANEKISNANIAANKSNALYDHEIMYVEGMPCIHFYIKNQAYGTQFSEAGFSCDWSKWESDK